MPGTAHISSTVVLTYKIKVFPLSAYLVYMVNVYRERKWKNEWMGIRMLENEWVNGFIKQ